MASTFGWPALRYDQWPEGPRFALEAPASPEEYVLINRMHNQCVISNEENPKDNKICAAFSAFFPVTGAVDEDAWRFVKYEGFFAGKTYFPLPYMAIDADKVYMDTYTQGYLQGCVVELLVHQTTDPFEIGTLNVVPAIRFSEDPALTAEQKKELARQRKKILAITRGISDTWARDNGGQTIEQYIEKRTQGLADRYHKAVADAIEALSLSPKEPP